MKEKQKIDYELIQISPFEAELEVIAEADEKLFMKFFNKAATLAKRKTNKKINPYNKLDYAKDMPLELPPSQYNRVKLFYRKSIKAIEQEIYKEGLHIIFIDYEFKIVRLQYNHKHNNWDLYIKLLVTFKREGYQ